MASRREYELLLSLKAALGGNFNSTFSTATKTMKTLNDKIKEISKTQSDISGYQKTQQALTDTRNSVDKLGQRHTDLQSKLDTTKQKEKELKKALEDSAKAAGVESDEYKQLQAELQKTQTEKETLRGQIKKNINETENANNKIEEQEKKLSTLRDELKKTGVDTDNLSQQNDKLKKTYDDLKTSQENFAKANQAYKENQEAISKTRTEFTKTIGVMAAGATAIYAGAVKPAIEFESAFAGVKKTVNATPEELAQISGEIRNLATVLPAGTTEISAVAEAAGQLGILTPNIMGFSKTMIDLGESTNLSATDAADSLARFANITGMSQGNFDRLGSVIVSLGNNFATTEAEIVEMSMRLAGAGAQVGLNEAQIMGLAASLSSVGIEAEMGGSAISKTLSNMAAAASSSDQLSGILDATGMSLRDLQMMASHDAKSFGYLAKDLGMTKTELSNLLKQGSNLQNFANIAGVSGSEFKAAFEKDAVGALQSFIKGLANADEQGESAIAMLEEMGLTEVRLRDTLLRAANASEIFNDSQTMAATAWKENIALTNEAEQRYATTESQIEIMKNNFNEVGITLGEVFIPMVAEASGNVVEIVQKIASFIKENKETVATVVKVVGGLLAAKAAFLGVTLVIQSVMGLYRGLKVAMAAYNLVQTGSNILKATSTAATAANTAATIASTGATAAATASTGALGVASGIAATSTWAFAGSLLAVAGPVLAVVAAIAVIVLAVKTLIKNWDKVKEVAINVWNKVKDVFGSIWKAVKDVFGKIGGFFVKAWEMVKAPFVAAFEWFNSNVIQPIINVFSPIIQKIGEIFSKIWEIITVLFGLLAQWFNDNVISPIVNFFTPIIQTIGGIFQSVWDTITGVFSSVVTWFSGVFGAAWDAIKNVFSVVGEFFQGVWDSIVSIFTTIGTVVGNAIGDAFKAVVNTIIGFAENTINFFIKGINGAIGLINAIPGVNIEPLTLLEIPRLYKGSENTPDTFVAGDINGKGGELITNARGRKVFTAAQTEQIFKNIKMAKLAQAAGRTPAQLAQVAGRTSSQFANATGRTPAQLAKAAGRTPAQLAQTAGRTSSQFAHAVGRTPAQLAQTAGRTPAQKTQTKKVVEEALTAPTLSAAANSGGGTYKIELNDNRTIHIDGNKPGDLDAKLAASNAQLLKQVEEMIRQREENERRQRYA